MTSTQTTAATPLQLAQDGAISATFTTNLQRLHARRRLPTQFVAANSVAGDHAARLRHRQHADQQHLLPRRSSRRPRCSRFRSAYSVYAGGCNANSWATAPAPPTVTVNPNATSSVVLPEPAMIVLPDPGATPSTTPTPALALTGQRWCTRDGPSGDYNSTETTSSTLNSTATAELHRHEHLVDRHDRLAATERPASAIDGGAATTVDTYVELDATPAADLHQDRPRRNGTHTITITVLGTQSSSSNGMPDLDRRLQRAGLAGAR